MIKAMSIETVSSAAVKDLFETCNALGVINEQNLNAIAIDSKRLNDPTLRFPENQLIDLWQLISKKTKRQNIGLLIGQTINPAAKGLLSSWVSQAESLSEALEIFRTHIALMNPSEHWDIEITKETCKLKFSLDENKAYPSIAVERSMSALVSWGRFLSGNEFPLIDACFKFPCPNHHKDFITIFGESVHFDMSENSLEFNSRLLNLPIANENQYLKALIGDKSKELLKELTKDYFFTLRTKKAIEEILLRKGPISIDLVCAELAISRQTLYRKLKKEGCNYKSLSEEYKKSESLKLLQLDSENITSISLRLGFKDTSSFYKAFRRWFGMSPKSYVRDLPNSFER